jgi:hypothetical protein
MGTPGSPPTRLTVVPDQPFEFFHRHFDLLEACFLQVATRPLFVWQDYKQVSC